MSTILTAGVILMVTLLVSGCFSTVSITRDPQTVTAKDLADTNVAGIPFFLKRGSCKQETVWIEPLITLTYSRTVKLKYTRAPKPGDEPLKPLVQSSTKYLSLSGVKHQRTAIDELRKNLSQARSFSLVEVEAMDRLWNTLALEPDYIPLQQDEDALMTSGNIIMVSNMASPETVVDYSRVHYYNARRPWIGSSQIDAKLNADGTLSEGSAQVESKTLAALLDFIPTKELIGAATGSAKAGVAAAPIPPGSLRALLSQLPGDVDVDFVELQLSLKQDNFRHTHTRYVAHAIPCMAAPGGVRDNFSFTVEAPSSGDTSDKSNAIDVVGKIKLPVSNSGSDGKSTSGGTPKK